MSFAITPNIFQTMNFPDHVLQAVAALRSGKYITEVSASLSAERSDGSYSSCLIFDDYVVKQSAQFLYMKNKYAQILDNGFGHMVPRTEFVDDLVIQEFVPPLIKCTNIDFIQKRCFLS